MNAVVTHTFQASAERVLDAYLSPAKIAECFAPGLGPMTRVAADARVGGQFNFTQHRGDLDAEHRGIYLEIERPTSLAFTWSVPPEPIDVSKVTIDIVPLETPEWEHFADRVAGSWRKMLEAIQPWPKQKAGALGDRRPSAH